MITATVNQKTSAFNQSEELSLQLVCHVIALFLLSEIIIAQESIPMINEYGVQVKRPLTNEQAKNLSHPHAAINFLNVRELNTLFKQPDIVANLTILGPTVNFDYISEQKFRRQINSYNEEFIRTSSANDRLLVITHGPWNQGIAHHTLSTIRNWPTDRVDLVYLLPEHEVPILLSSALTYAATKHKINFVVVPDIRLGNFPRTYAAETVISDIILRPRRMAIEQSIYFFDGDIRAVSLYYFLLHSAEYRLNDSLDATPYAGFKSEDPTEFPLLACQSLYDCDEIIYNQATNESITPGSLSKYAETQQDSVTILLTDEIEFADHAELTFSKIDDSTNKMEIIFREYFNSKKGTHTRPAFSYIDVNGKYMNIERRAGPSNTDANFIEGRLVMTVPVGDAAHIRWHEITFKGTPRVTQTTALSPSFAMPESLKKITLSHRAGTAYSVILRSARMRAERLVGPELADEFLKTKYYNSPESIREFTGKHDLHIANTYEELKHASTAIRKLFAKLDGINIEIDRIYPAYSFPHCESVFSRHKNWQ